MRELKTADDRSSRLNALQRPMSIRLTVLAACGVLALTCLAASAQQVDSSRGQRNYQDLIAGRKRVEQLSPQEQREVMLIVRRSKAQSDEGKSSECRDALAKAASAASDLATYSRRLQVCAANEDYSEDCSSEFRRVRNAHSDYEDAVSDVGSNCH